MDGTCILTTDTFAGWTRIRRTRSDTRLRWAHNFRRMCVSTTTISGGRRMVQAVAEVRPLTSCRVGWEASSSDESCFAVLFGFFIGLVDTRSHAENAVNMDSNVTGLRFQQASGIRTMRNKMQRQTLGHKNCGNLRSSSGICMQPQHSDWYLHPNNSTSQRWSHCVPATLPRSAHRRFHESVGMPSTYWHVGAARL